MFLQTSIFRLIFICLLFFQSSFSFAQGLYKQGEITYKSGEKATVYIQYRNWEINPSIIKIKKEKDGPVQKISALQIQSFTVDHHLYYGAVVTEETSPWQFEKMHDHPYLETKLDTVFLEVIYDGNKVLLSKKSKEGRVNYYIKEGEAFTLLKQKKYIKKNYKGDRLVLETKEYISQLNEYLSDCKTIFKQLSKTKYTKSSLFKLFKYYYSNTNNNEIKENSRNEKVFTQLSISGGMSFTSLNFSGSFKKHIYDSDFSNSLTPTFGLELDIVFPKNNEKWAISNHLYFDSYSVESDYLLKEHDNKYTSYSNSISYSYISYNLLLKHKFLISETSNIFLEVGPYIGLVINADQKTSSRQVLFEEQRKYENDALEDISSSENGVSVGIGFQQNRFSLGTKFIVTNGMSKYVSLSSIVMRSQLLLRYQLTSTK